MAFGMARGEHGFCGGDGCSGVGGGGGGSEDGAALWGQGVEVAVEVGVERGVNVL